MIDVADSNAVYYYHFDGLGSVAALSNISGDIVERYSYDVFGQPAIKDAGGAVISDSNYDNPYMFTGRRLDEETDNYYYRARIYDPETGRFLQPDPVAMYLQLFSTQLSTKNDFPGLYLFSDTVKHFLQNDPVGRFLAADPAGRFLQMRQFGAVVELNLHTYCGNNPVVFVDPHGLVWGWVGTVTMAVGGAMIMATAASTGVGIALVIIGAGLVIIGARGAFNTGKGLCEKIEERGPDQWDEKIDQYP